MPSLLKDQNPPLPAPPLVKEGRGDWFAADLEVLEGLLG